MTFDQFNIHEQLLEAISYMNFEKASPIQELAIPIILEGHDLLASAQTGTGKTATFVIPILHDIVVNGDKGTITYIIVPTRELAIQIHQEIQGFSYFTNTSCKAVFGGDKGKDWEQQKRALVDGTNIIIATPGRLMAHLQLGYVDCKNIRHLVLDEADRMLDMGFYDDIQKILTYLPEERQTLMFSATMPPNIQKLANTILTNPKQVTISIAKPAAGVTQLAYLTYSNQKIGTILHIVEQNPTYDSIIIFSSTKKNINQIVRALRQKMVGLTVDGISSDLEQAEREEVLLKFRAKQTKVLVATDVLSRGIDIKGVNVVINFDVPSDAADYVHRVGRTARADAKGEAITLVSDLDMRKFAGIEKLIDKEVPKLMPPAELGEGPIWNPNSSGAPQFSHKKNFNSSKSSSNSSDPKKRFFRKKKKE